MFKEFNIKFEDVEMFGGSDSLLEGTNVTKVILRGDNKLSSLNSMLKNCNQLDTIDGNLNLDGISDIDNLLQNTELVTNISLNNVNNKDITANNSIPHISQLSIGGETYNKEAIQSVISSREWTFDSIAYKDTVGENIITNTLTILEEQAHVGGVIADTLEQKAKGISIEGQTLHNLINGVEGGILAPDIKLESVDGVYNIFETNVSCHVYVQEVKGQSFQEEGVMRGVGDLQEDGTYKISITTDNGYEKIWEEL